jgi:hypothetical protein
MMDGNAGGSEGAISEGAREMAIVDEAKESAG